MYALYASFEFARITTFDTVDKSTLQFSGGFDVVVFSYERQQVNSTLN
jgi:hypothetical protein